MFIAMKARVMAALANISSLFHSPERRYTPVYPTLAYVPGPVRSARTARLSSSWGKWKRPRQEGAMARRVRQIHAGTLRFSNGLIRPKVNGGFVTANSHGTIVAW